MNKFDSSITFFFNKFAQLSYGFDHAMVFLSSSNLLKGGILVLIICWLWFKTGNQQENIRKHLISTILSSFAAIVIARGLALTLPFRVRPLHEAVLSFILPSSMYYTYLDGWSSFPSDHAAMFFTLSFGLLYASKKLGVFALIYTTLFIAFPRIYLGLHYFTDIFAGIGLGILISWIGNLSFITNKVVKIIMPWINKKPQIFYTSYFFIIYQIADMFEGSRELASAGLKLIQSFLK